MDKEALIKFIQDNSKLTQEIVVALQAISAELEGLEKRLEALEGEKD